jgi:hypothetical protein
MAAQTATDARVALLSELIDHAPMFPPAQLPLDEALADHEAALASDASWLVNRFVVRASKLAELPAGRPLRLSVVVDAEFAEDSRIEALEAAHSAGPLLPGGARDVFVEHPAGAAFEPWLLATIAGTGLHTKVRCGGEVVPSTSDLAGVIRACRSAGVAFKATAGLHHPVRTDAEHGFLNLLAAVVFGDEEEALAERDPSAFELDSDSFRWRDRAADAGQVRAVRRDLFVSIGSCSFFEPVDELRGLGMLPA